MKRAKIVATLGPATDAPGILEAIVRAGVDVARFNFSHGEQSEHVARLKRLRAVAAALGKPVAAMADLQGPKIRVGKFPGGAVHLTAGAPYLITTRPIDGDATGCSTTYDRLPGDVKAGDQLYLADGTIQMEVEAVAGPDVRCRVVEGGRLSSNKGINLPDVTISEPSLTEKDLADLDFILGEDFDYVALSFVRSPEDVRDLKQRIHRAGRRMGVVAKIEKKEALARIDEIIPLCAAIMIARGDLGVEAATEDVPVLQKTLVSKCNNLGVPVITATQMLESMTDSPRPTRAEASDVANAIFDGSDAVMLSGETAAGSYPLKAVETMAAIAEKAERFRHDNIADDYVLDPTETQADATARAACQAAADLGARRVVTLTESGATAFKVAKYRPATGLVALTPHAGTANRLALCWGCQVRVIDSMGHFDEVMARMDEELLAAAVVEPGELIVIVAGWPFEHPGTTNLIKVHRVERRDKVKAAPPVPTSERPVTLSTERCTGCGFCVKLCPFEIFAMAGDTAVIVDERMPRCTGDGKCVRACPVDAIAIRDRS